jgi:hypothetical protein
MMVSDDSRFKMSSKVRESDGGKYNPKSEEEIVGVTKEEVMQPRSYDRASVFGKWPEMVGKLSLRSILKPGGDFGKERQASSVRHANLYR